MINSDITFYIYFLAVFVSLFGFFLFGWWWIRIGSATDVYIYVSLIFLTNAFSDSIALYARYLRNIDPSCMTIFHNTYLWDFRRIPELTILIIFIVRMLMRVNEVYKLEKRGEVVIGKRQANLKSEKEKES